MIIGDLTSLNTIAHQGLFLQDFGRPSSVVRAFATQLASGLGGVKGTHKAVNIQIFIQIT